MTNDLANHMENYHSQLVTHISAAYSDEFIIVDTTQNITFFPPN